MMANPTSAKKPKLYPEIELNPPERYPEIIKYLTPDVTPVTLPENDKVEKGRIPATFPPLILDGASGIGKTQQAFALLKANHKLVYLNLAEANSRQPLQYIYNEMVNLTKMRDLLDEIDNVLSEVRETSNLDFKSDPFSMESIGDHIRKWKEFREWNGDENSGDNETEKIATFISLLHSRVLMYDPSDKKIKRHDFESLDKPEENLRQVVLFVDEALPSPGSSKGTECPKDRLKFLRNLGRVLQMRVVLAGTAATAANMWKKSEEDASNKFSRPGGKQFTWAVVEFLYRLIPDNPDNPDSQIKHRPLVRNWLADLGEGKTMAEKIKHLGIEISSAKAFSGENVFTWLTGAYLSACGNPISPFRQQPSALVRDHFFEPALATCEFYGPDDEGKIEIHDGKGFGKISRKIREPGTRLEIVKYVNSGQHYWILKGGDFRPAFSFDYEFVEYALTNCVQVCLATEPLFALCISASHNRLTREELDAAINITHPETTVQRNSGGLDGELNEQIMFAALQLSSNTIMDSPTEPPKNLEDFVEQLYIYLQPSYGKYVDIRYMTAKDFLKREGIQLTEKPKVEDRKISFQYDSDGAKTLFKEETMPWLVPACDKVSLQERIQAYGANYFEDLKIAGLVPGITNAPMDAEAFLWATKDTQELMPYWAFEFRARSSFYSPKEAMEDLKKKLTVKEQAKPCHGMLIAMTNREKSLCRTCIVKAGVSKKKKKSYLRVIVLIGCSNL